MHMCRRIPECQLLNNFFVISVDTSLISNEQSFVVYFFLFVFSLLSLLMCLHIVITFVEEIFFFEIGSCYVPLASLDLTM